MASLTSSLDADRAALEVKGLCKLYGSSSGVSDVSLTVERGTLHGFLGPNGAGKTTTMKCVMGLLRRTSGEIRIFGDELHGEGVQLRKRIGYSPELPSYPSYLRGREVLLTYGRMREITDKAKLEEESRALLQGVGLTDASEKLVGKYSRGMQTRLGLAVALLGNPDLLLLDEPTEGLDPVAVISVRGLFRQLVSEGRTILLSSHQLSEVQQMCSRVTVVNRGRTVAEGSVEELTKRLRGGVSYRAEFTLLTQELQDALRGIDGVLEIARLNESAIRILSAKEDDLRPLLAKRAVESGSLLLSCVREETSLEELFISLVKPGTN